MIPSPLLDKRTIKDIACKCVHITFKPKNKIDVKTTNNSNNYLSIKLTNVNRRKDFLNFEKRLIIFKINYQKSVIISLSAKYLTISAVKQ